RSSSPSRRIQPRTELNFVFPIYQEALNMLTTTAKSIGKYLNVVDKIRQQWKVEKHLELWFRAEDLRHYDTRLQPGLYRPNAFEIELEMLAETKILAQRLRPSFVWRIPARSRR